MRGFSQNNKNKICNALILACAKHLKYIFYKSFSYFNCWVVRWVFEDQEIDGIYGSLTPMSPFDRPILSTVDPKTIIKTLHSKFIALHLANHKLKIDIT